MQDISLDRDQSSTRLYTSLNVFVLTATSFEMAFEVKSEEDEGQPIVKEERSRSRRSAKSCYLTYVVPRRAGV